MADFSRSGNKKANDLTATILVGGLGTRLRPVIADRQKVLAAIHGRPFLAYLLDQLADAAIRSVVLCTGYRGEDVKAMFGDSYGPMKLLYSEERSPLGTGGALRHALPLLPSDPVLVLNGDSFCDLDLNAFWNWHRAHAARATLALVQVSDTRRYGRVHSAPDGKVMRFEEKGSEGGSGWINAGIYLLAHSVLQTIPTDGAVSLEQAIFPRWIGRGLYGYPSRGRFLDIGTPESYATAEQFFAK
ncbi:MAG: nucleotidyltransferase family protein [Nitrospirae bacterium]|nr:nucleotidyltransferase family protein [Nitrospirota bacterium]